MRVATANMHKMFGVCTDYYVHLNLIECEGRPSGPGSYSHYLDFWAGSRPSYWYEAAMRNTLASASHRLSRKFAAVGPVILSISSPIFSGNVTLDAQNVISDSFRFLTLRFSRGVTDLCAPFGVLTPRSRAGCNAFRA